MEAEKKEEPLKQPWLTKEQIFKGKSRNVEIKVFNRENESQVLNYDRQFKEKSEFMPCEKSEESTDDSNWPRFQRSLITSSETELMLEILADLNSHTIVAIGGDKIKDEDARQYLKSYRDYLTKKEARIFASVEKELKWVERKKAQKSKKKIDFSEKEGGVNEPNEKSKSLETPGLKEEPIAESTEGDLITLKRRCTLCQEEHENLEDHLLLTHYKTRILDEYPCLNFKCHFPKCSFVTIPKSTKYVKHIGLEHNILEKWLKEDMSSSETILLTPQKSNAKEEGLTTPSSPQVNFRFKCPMCDKKDVTDPRSHLSKHFADRVKDDFPFIKDDKGVMCPIADCKVDPMTSAKLVHHINLDHDQINLYLQEDENLCHLSQVLKTKKRKRKNSAGDGTPKKVQKK